MLREILAAVNRYHAGRRLGPISSCRQQRVQWLMIDIEGQNEDRGAIFRQRVIIAGALLGELKDG